MHTLRMAAVTRQETRDDLPGDPVAGDGAQQLPPALSSALAEFCRHLAAERALSRHTVRAYQGDIQSLLEYAWQSGVGQPGQLDLVTLRGWLASTTPAPPGPRWPAGVRPPALSPPTRTARAGSAPTRVRNWVPRRRGGCCRRCCAGTR